MIVNTKTGEVYDRPPQAYWNTKKMRRRHDNVWRDVAIALAIYSFGATCVIAGLLA